MLEHKARALFEAHSPYPGKALLHHNIRLAEFTLALGRLSGRRLDSDFVRASCHLHDFGLFVKDPEEPLYLKRSWKFLAPHASSWGLEGDRLQIFREILEYNHSLRPVAGLSREAELVRQAVQIEHSSGIVRHGLNRNTCRFIFAAYPRFDLTAILVDFARITFFEDGPMTLLPMFLPAGPTSPRSARARMG